MEYFGLVVRIRGADKYIVPGGAPVEVTTSGGEDVWYMLLRRDFLSQQGSASTHLDLRRKHAEVSEQLDKVASPLMLHGKRMLQLASPMERVLELLRGLRASGVLHATTQEQLADTNDDPTAEQASKGTQ